ncbi:MAG: 16S rRNA (adenine(1518)-N(6)/adenine(1519)-N(6))-dimethyltransferase RsmA [Eudoraea sp.]|nr:16S rRNA (adenine(1518)-N(6)/adenine(1519)-N(6))-dimethyltransferase RsmA [Eudoraea sp.]
MPSKFRSPVRPKKHLGQHFLKDREIAQRIARTLEGKEYEILVEVGPGTGILTEYLLPLKKELILFEIDTESVRYLEQWLVETAQAYKSRGTSVKIYEKNFLKSDLQDVTNNKPFGIIGNFPYNISSQIVFKMLENRHLVPEFAGMFQKEVAQRICEQEGSKQYGIISVLVQAFYEAEYLFTVPPEAFDPPPKVDSGVLRLTRRKIAKLPCSEVLFTKVVKTAFNQRRKTLRNSLKSLQLPKNLTEDAIFDRRPEQLSVAEFIALTVKIEDDTI